MKAGREIDIDELRAVFDDNNGYVYLGTKNTDNSEDYSSTMSWNKFRNEYLENDYVENVDETENGEWLKVIDNDATCGRLRPEDRVCHDGHRAHC